MKRCQKTECLVLISEWIGDDPDQFWRVLRELKYLPEEGLLNG